MPDSTVLVGLAALLAGGSAKPVASDALNTKLGAYVECINLVSPAVFLSRQQYALWVDLKKGPTGKEPSVTGLLAIRNTERCSEGIAKAETTAPDLPDVEAVAGAYSRALTAAQAAVNRASDYYAQGDYKDDKMARGRALHPELMAAWAAFQSADEALRGQVSRIAEGIAEEELARLEAGTRKLPYYVRKLTFEARKLARAGAVEVAEALDLQQFQPQLESYEASVTALDSYAEAHKQEVTDIAFPLFVDTAKAYLASAKGLMRRKRDKVQYTDGERMLLGKGSSWMVEGSPGHLIKKYNELVDRSNYLSIR